MGLVGVRGITSALVLLLSAVAALAQPRQVEAPPKGPTTFAVSKARSAVKVDGVLDEAAWGSAAVVPVAYEWAPGDNIPAPVTTQCLVTFDTKNVYVAFRAADPRPAEIRAHLMDRDDVDTLIQDDHVGLMIDTFNDERRAFQFRVNPLGVQADAIFSEQDGVEDFSWDMIWSSAGRVTEDGYTEYPAAVADEHGQPTQPFGGNGIWVDYQRITRNYQLFGNFESYDKGFRSDTGFVPRVDYRNVSGQGQRRWWREAGAWFNTLDLGVRAWRSTTADQTMTDRTVAAFVNYTGPFQTQAQFNMPQDVVVYEGTRYKYYRPNFAFGIKPTGDTSLLVTGRCGGGVDFANARKATQALQFGPAVEYRPIPRVSLSLRYDMDQLSVEGGRLYRAHLAQVKGIYHLNVRTFVRAIIQYTDISRDPALYRFQVEPRTRRLFSQFLFSFKVNPQTVLFLGYSDNAANATHIDLQRQDRTFFIKLGYAWVL